MRLKILDIKHTGHHGTYGESKVGRKYDERRGKEFEILEEEFIKGQPLMFFLEKYNLRGLLTTPFEKKRMVDGDIMEIETLNSIYVCQVLEDEDEDL